MSEELYPVAVEVNGVTRRGQVPARLTLVDWLRDELRLTGTHVGCEHGICGACSVLLDGADVREVSMRSVHGAVAVVSDDPFLFSASVAENIAYARPGASREEVEQAARRAQAHEFIARLPQGYDTQVGERGLTLSGGQRQRLAIARALLSDPRVLILDDATSSVDASTEQSIKVALGEAMSGRTTFVIAHRLSTIALADEIVVLDHGRIVAQGRHEELIDSSPLYREIAAADERPPAVIPAEEGSLGVLAGSPAGSER